MMTQVYREDLVCNQKRYDWDVNSQPWLDLFLFTGIVILYIWAVESY
jgi:hypothetical protein